MLKKIVVLSTFVLALIGCKNTDLLDRPVDSIYFPYGSNEGNYESLYSGKILSQGESIKLENSSDPFVTFLYQFMESHRSDDIELVLSYWASDDQEQIRKFMSDDDMLAKSIERAESILSAEIVGYITHDGYTLAMVEIDWEGFGRSVKIYPIKVEGGRFVATNDLKTDKALHDVMAYGYAGWQR